MKQTKKSVPSPRSVVKRLILVACAAVIVIASATVVYARYEALHRRNTTTPSALAHGSGVWSSSLTITPPIAPKVTWPQPKAPVARSSTHTTSSSSTTTPTPSVTPQSVSALTPTSTPSSPSTPSTYTATNWAGYAARGSSYASVAGSWVIPSPSPNGAQSADAAWVGIGGIAGSDLIQAGTVNAVDGSGAVATRAFYELLPAGPVYPTLVVTPGDSMTVSLQEVSAGSWSITITDNTTGQSYATTVSYSSSHSSAEWIEEDPSYANGTLVPLDYFGAITFTGGTTTVGGAAQSIQASGAGSVTMINSSGAALVRPSAVSGGSFTATRTATPS